LLEEGLIDNAARLGAYLMGRLCEWPERFGCVGDVRGIGLMIGVELVRDRDTKEKAPDLRDRLLEMAFERGLLLLGAGENTIRLCPPLTVTREQADFAVSTLENCLVAACAE
jgi:4-aminobutyrate aminotransferase